LRFICTSELGRSGCRKVAYSIFAWAAYITFEKNEYVLSWVFVVLAIIYNPIIKIHFPKEMWSVIGFCSGVFFVLVRSKIQKSR